MFNRLALPLIAIVLGLLPFVLFVGSTNTVDVNGARVREESFNLLGLILAVLGIVLAMQSIRPLRGAHGYGRSWRSLPLWCAWFKSWSRLGCCQRARSCRRSGRTAICRP